MAYRWSVSALALARIRFIQAIRFITTELPARTIVASQRGLLFSIPLPFFIQFTNARTRRVGADDAARKGH
jgi:hypothetical protein